MSFDSEIPRGGLVLCRRIGEEVVIAQADRIVAVVQVVNAADSDRAWVRVRAPADVTIDRAEVFDRRRRAAAGGLGA